MGIRIADPMTMAMCSLNVCFFFFVCVRGFVGLTDKFFAPLCLKDLIWNGTALF